MSFNPNIPLAGDFLAVSQKQILANYQAIANTFLINHVPLTAEKNIGMHDALTLRPQNSDPTTSANQSAIYNKLVSTVPQLFFRPSSNQTPIQLSNSNLNTIQTGASPFTQSSYIAGPFTIYMGTIQNCPNGQLVTLTPSTTLKYVGLSTILPGARTPDLATTAVATGLSGNQFTVTYNTGQLTSNPTIYYTSIGI